MANVQTYKERGIGKMDYSRKTMNRLAEMLEIDEGASIQQIARLYTLNELFEALLACEGIVGCGELIREIVKEIYSVDLNQIKE